MSLRARTWHQSHTLDHRQFSLEQLTADRDQTVSVCLPSRNEEATIGEILDRLMPLVDAGLVDQVLVVDGSQDRTQQIARDRGATVWDQEDLLPEHGPVVGKGDAMWRALSVLTGDIVCFLDADSEHFDSHFLCGMLGPLLTDPECQMVKGFYRRPFRVGDITIPEGGGRVTELAARPLLNLFYPDLSGVMQPLAGEVAGRRKLFEQLAFSTGYGVDIGLLIDTYRTAGLDAITQVNLDVRQNQHQSLRDLSLMAFAVLQAVSSRLQREGRLSGELSTEMLLPGLAGVGQTPAAPSEVQLRIVERPPIASVVSAT